MTFDSGALDHLDIANSGNDRMIHFESDPDTEDASALLVYEMSNRNVRNLYSTPSLIVKGFFLSAAN